ncbi:MAG: tetratricopeptide repeat protein [Rhodospirillaceae bacterium]
MSLEEGFFSSEVFRSAATPGVASAWRRLQLGDPEGAEFFADGVSEDEAGIAGLAQLRAAIAIARGDAAAAAAALQAALPRLEVPAETAALSCQAALCAWETGDAAAARAAFAASIAAADTPETWAAWARRERAGGAADAALRVLADGLARHPGHPDLLNVLAACELAARRFDAALAALDRLPPAFAAHPLALVNRGNALLGLRRFDAARQAFDAALAAEPDLCAALYGRAAADFESGADAAEAGLAAVLARQPLHPEASVLLARLLVRTGRAAAARALLEELLHAAPDCFAALYHLAVILRDAGEIEAAEARLVAAFALRPEAVHLNDLLGLLRLDRGDLSGAQAAFARAAAALAPEAAAYESNRLYALHYDPGATPEEIAAAHRAYGARFGGVGEDEPFANPPEPERPLRIGYVSPDFRAHSVAFFMMAPVTCHDRARFEVFAYSNAPCGDGATRWFADAADAWRDVRNLTFDEMRALIRADGIDILVDLAGHTGDNLLPMFARRAAPVQVSWLGYPDTTGVPAIDARIVDALTDPPGAEALASERLIRLPRPFICYRPTADLPPVAAGPLASGRPMTFGSFNTSLKLNGPLFDAWAEILHAVPEARLLLKAKPFASPAARAWAAGALFARGVAAERIDIRAFAPTLGAHLDLYGEIDLALDTFPYNGTTTTCEALAMGVPVLSLAGDRHCARVGESLLRATGLAADFLAADTADYVRRAVAWADRRGELAAMRAGLRERLLASPLCDEAGFTAALEDAYRGLWRDWCGGSGARCSLGPSPFETELRAACAAT